MSLFPLSNIMLIRSRVRHLLGDRPGKNLSTGPYALSVVRRPTPATSSATPTGRRWPTSISRGNPAGARRRSSSPGRGISLCNAELRTALLYNRLVRFLSEGTESTDVAREASFDEAKAQHQCSTGVERRRIVIVAGKRSVCRNWQACSGYADAENRNKPRNHSL